MSKLHVQVVVETYALLHKRSNTWYWVVLHKLVFSTKQTENGPTAMPLLCIASPYYNIILVQCYNNITAIIPFHNFYRTFTTAYTIKTL